MVTTPTEQIIWMNCCLFFSFWPPGLIRLSSQLRLQHQREPLRIRKIIWYTHKERFHLSRNNNVVYWIKFIELSPAEFLVLMSHFCECQLTLMVCEAPWCGLEESDWFHFSSIAHQINHTLKLKVKERHTVTSAHISQIWVFKYKGNGVPLCLHLIKPLYRTKVKLALMRPLTNFPSASHKTVSQQAIAVSMSASWIVCIYMTLVVLY